MKTSKSVARNKYQSILEILKVPEHVKRHCLAVGDAASNIASALNSTGKYSLDVDVIHAAGYLHDMARAHRDHDIVGAEMMRGPSFERFGLNENFRKTVADVIEGHMKLDFPLHASEIDEKVVVSLADRIVRQDRYVGYEARMEDLLKRYLGNTEVEARVHRNMEKAMRLIGEIEALTGKTICEMATAGHVDIEGVLLRVERPGRYIGGEVNSIQKDWGDTLFRFCFAFPDLYDIGMSYTGFQVIYGLLNERPDSLCERVFAPAADMAELLKSEGLPLFSLENRMPVRLFDMVGFTLQYELCYTNVVRMLMQSDIPVYAADRSSNDPIIIAGGPCSANAEPVATFLDLICYGDGEEVLPALADLYIRIGKDDREEFLHEASKIQGVYSPGFYSPIYSEPDYDDKISVFDGFQKKYDDLPNRIERAVVSDLETAFFPIAPVISHIETVHDRAAVEIMRGCYRKCHFCQASYACDGVRKRSLEKIKEILFDTLSNTGYDEVSLLSLSTGDYPGIETLITELMDELKGIDVSLSLPSLRLDSLKEGTLAKIAEYKRSGLTFAPEAGTQRLRDSIGKQITEEDLLNALDIALPLGFSKFKFYFMIGLPGETYEDLDGIASLATLILRRAKEISREHGVPYRYNISVSASNFVPKPGTPLERACGDSEELLMEKIRYLKDAIHKVKGVSFKYHDTRMSRIEMLLAKGDRRAAEAVKIAAESGSGFDSWREHFDYNNWLNAFEKAGLPATDLYADNERGPLPWDMISSGKAYPGEIK